jgi:hypothetical protein
VGSLSSLVGFGLGTETFVASGGGAVSPLVASGAGAFAFVGVGAGSLSPLVGAGVARLVITGAGGGDFSSITAIGFDPRGGEPPYTIAIALWRRSALLAAAPARAGSVAVHRRSALVAEPSQRSLALVTPRRAVALYLRGVPVSTYAIYQGDNAPALDVQVRDNDGGVPCVEASAVLLWRHQHGATGALTLSPLTPSEGWWRH